MINARRTACQLRISVRLTQSSRAKERHAILSASHNIFPRTLAVFIHPENLDLTGSNGLSI